MSPLNLPVIDNLWRAQTVPSEMAHNLLAGCLMDQRQWEALAARSYLHPNGFIKVPLGRTANGATIVLHHWPKPGGDPDIHNHRWDFETTLINGEMLVTHFSVSAGGDHLRAYRYQSPGRGLSYKLDQGEAVLIREEFVARLRAGASYFLQRDVFHKVHATMSDTLTVVAQSADARDHATVVLDGRHQRGGKRPLRRPEVAAMSDIARILQSRANGDTRSIDNQLQAELSPSLLPVESRNIV